MRALFLIRDMPYPDDTGYKKRNMALIRELSKRGFEVILFSPAADGDNFSADTVLTGYCKKIISVPVKKQHKLFVLFRGIFSTVPFGAGYRSHGELLDAVRGYVADHSVDIMICDSVYRALNVPFDLKVYKVLCEQNVESVILKRYAINANNPVKRVFALLEFLKLRRFERLIWRRFDLVVACSETDKAYMLKSAEGVRVCVVNNGVDSEFFMPYGKSFEKDKNIVFTGQLGWYPNRDALRYFVDRIFPLVKKEIPEVVFWVVGRSIGEKIQDLNKNDPRIKVTGFVEDVRPYIAKAGVCVVPVRIGSGTRIKILEALSMEKTVVTTSIGCEGLETEDGKHLVIRDDAEGFARAVIDILKRRDRYTFLGINGRKLVEKKYVWDNVFKSLDEVFSREAEAKAGNDLLRSKMV
ncbi:MAG: glycosyltransferase family 4 protein [Candidatus Omnitrophota bacterium]